MKKIELNYGFVYFGELYTGMYTVVYFFEFRGELGSERGIGRGDFFGFFDVYSKGMEVFEFMVEVFLNRGIKRECGRIVRKFENF